jgi:hypothetical protein
MHLPHGCTTVQPNIGVSVRGRRCHACLVLIIRITHHKRAFYVRSAIQLFQALLDLICWHDESIRVADIDEVVPSFHFQQLKPSADFQINQRNCTPICQPTCRQYGDVRVVGHNVHELVCLARVIIESSINNRFVVRFVLKIEN